MALITLHDISLSFSDQPLLDNVSFAIDHGERVCLIGRNGTGKSTLFSVITGAQQADDGQLNGVDAIRVTQLEQAVPQGITGSVFDVVAAGLGEAGKLLQRYHELSAKVADDNSLLSELEKCQQALEDAGGWEINQRVETTLARLSLDGDAHIEALSGGLKRRVLLARALVTEPDLLLLDEPTNHLDIAAIEWLEGFLKTCSASLLFITHDRAFLRKLATRIIELDRGQLSDWRGDYDHYLRGKQQLLDAESKQNALFDKRLAEEETWIRQGIKARRTRNEGRVRALKQMRNERAARRELQGKAKLATQTHKSSGKIVAETQALEVGFDGETIIKPLTTTILRGDKIGIIGPNGCGKTTLIKSLLGELEPTAGNIKLGTNLEVAYFDQYRSLIDPKKSVQDNVADGSDTVTINGKPRHVIGYLGDFLFAPRRVRQPAAALSGGERNRLMLAKLFTRAANLLVMDEPTNDLDMDTLDLLESLLVEYSGTLLLVSHDRAFINNVVTSTLVFEGDGVVNEYVGGYDDWLRQREQPEAITSKSASNKASLVQQPKKAKPKKLSYQLQRELDAIPKQIQALEEQIATLTEAMSQSDFYNQLNEIVIKHQDELQTANDDLEKLFERWEELESEA